MINLLLITILILEIIYRPRIDQTIVGDILLYYNSENKRKYIKLW